MDFTSDFFFCAIYQNAAAVGQASHDGSIGEEAFTLLKGEGSLIDTPVGRIAERDVIPEAVILTGSFPEWHSAGSVPPSESPD